MPVFSTTSYLDKILIAAPKLSGLTFINARPPGRPRGAIGPFFLVSLSMEVNSEYMIYLAGERLRGGPPFQRAGRE